MVELIGGASVSSKGKMPTGLRAERVFGNKVLLENGHWYVDWPMGLHGAIYGYWPDWVPEGCQSASIPSREEYVVAQMLADFYPDIEAVRFMCTGSDPNAAAAKLARAVTGRDRLLVYGYHGNASCYCTPPEVSGTAIDMRRGTLRAERNAYVPLVWEPARYSEEIAWSFRGLDETVAAVVIEVPSVDGGRTNATCWLRQLAEKAHRAGALFVLDEVKTAFRYRPGGAAEEYGLFGYVDLYCFGKTLGNGYPISALAGKKAVMQELTNGVHYSGTFFGEPLGLAAAKTTLTLLRQKPPWHHLYDIGNYLIKEWNRRIKSPSLRGHPTRPELSGPPDSKALFRRSHLVLESPWYITTETTTKDVNSLVEAATHG